MNFLITLVDNRPVLRDKATARCLILSFLFSLPMFVEIETCRITNSLFKIIPMLENGVIYVI